MPVLERVIPVGSFQENCWIVACAQTGKTVLIDPGDEAPKILDVLKEMQVELGLALDVQAILLTHAHVDHVSAIRDLKQHFQNPKTTPKTQKDPQGKTIQIYLHPGDAELYRFAAKQGAYFGLSYEDPPPVDHSLEEGQTLQFGGLKFTVIHTPGHSPGGVCLYLQTSTPGTLYTGDTLFQGSVGRTDLWGGNQDLLFENIRNKIFTLPEDVRVCPGHGPESTVGAEKNGNPFL